VRSRRTNRLTVFLILHEMPMNNQTERQSESKKENKREKEREKRTGKESRGGEEREGIINASTRDCSCDRVNLRFHARMRVTSGKNSRSGIDHARKSKSGGGG